MARRIRRSDDLETLGDEYNKMGENAAQAGIQQGLHNEDFDSRKSMGQRTYDVLIGLLDPKAGEVQFQSQHLDGYDAAHTS